MSRALMAELERFKGRQLIDCIDEIQIIADHHGFSVNVIDPEFNNHSIDNEPRRLNVRTNRDSVIISFSIG